jgi:hypothetical protein
VEPGKEFLETFRKQMRLYNRINSFRKSLAQIEKMGKKLHFRKNHQKILNN